MRILITGGSGFVGTNLIERYLLEGRHKILNADIAPPRNPAQAHLWEPCDLRNAADVTRVFQKFSPEQVFHLGARTDLVTSRDLTNYAANTQGVRNVIDAVAAHGGIERTIYASTRLVFAISYSPQSDYDYFPSTDYGRSKIVGEELVRALADAGSPWTLVRPTSLWGPWFQTPYREFFDTVVGGRYLHPRGKTVMKSFGYVGNSIEQLEGFRVAPVADVRSRVFWLCDYEPINVMDWATTVSSMTSGRRVRSSPEPILRAIARAGDLVSATGTSAPLTTFRLNNLLTNMVYDSATTRAVTPKLPYTMESGALETVNWLKSQKQL